MLLFDNFMSHTALRFERKEHRRRKKERDVNDIYSDILLAFSNNHHALCMISSLKLMDVSLLLASTSSFWSS